MRRDGFDGAMRHLDRNVDFIWRATGGGNGPVRHAREPLAAAVLDLEPAKTLPLAIRDDNVVLLARPIDGDVSTSQFAAHLRLQDQTHAPRACLRSRRFLYWRSRHRTAGRGLPTGCRSQPIRRGTGPKLVLVARDAEGDSTANRLGRGRMHPSATPLIHASFRYAPLRTNERQTLPSNRAGKVQDADWAHSRHAAGSL